MRILITGAAGFIGSHLAERLAGLGHDVVGIDSFTDFYSRALKDINAADIKEKGVKLLELDLTKDDLSQAVAGVDVVYHLAGQPGISANTPFEDYLQNNIVATEKLLLAVENLPSLKGFINIATSSVYGAFATGNENSEPKPTSYYGVTKLAAEQLVLARNREKGLPAVSTRLFSVYGERERPEKLHPKLIRSILENKEFPLGEGSDKHVRAYTYVGDIVDGFVLVLDNLDKCIGEIFNLGTNVPITTGEDIKIIEEIIGKKANLVVKPRRPGDQEKTEANIEKAVRMLGYNPKTTPQEGLKKEVEWYMNKIHGKVNF